MSYKEKWALKERDIRYSGLGFLFPLSFPHQARTLVKFVQLSALLQLCLRKQSDMMTLPVGGSIERATAAERNVGKCPQVMEEKSRALAWNERWSNPAICMEHVVTS